MQYDVLVCHHTTFIIIGFYNNNKSSSKIIVESDDLLNQFLSHISVSGIKAYLSKVMSPSFCICFDRLPTTLCMSSKERKYLQKGFIWSKFFCCSDLPKMHALDTLYSKSWLWPSTTSFYYIFHITCTWLVLLWSFNRSALFVFPNKVVHRWLFNIDRCIFFSLSDGAGESIFTGDHCFKVCFVCCQWYKGTR